jgi:mono/diheme cytochrome c family protein
MCFTINLLSMKSFILSWLLILVLLSCGRSKKPSDSTPTESGNEVYMKYCLACHQTDGSGVPGMYPTLQKTDWVQGDKARLISLILNGQQGEIIVNGQVFKGVMPAHQYLSDAQIADVLTHIRSNYGNIADAVTPDEVSQMRTIQTGQN